MFKKLLLPTLQILFSVLTNAQTKLPAFLGDYMVLQQQEEVTIWGEDLPDVTVEIIASWGGRGTATAASNGKWEVEVLTPEAGGPYTISIKGSEKIILNNVLIGEVWFCSGQSNMEYTMRYINEGEAKGSNEAILYSKNDQIRLFKTKRAASEKPLDNVCGGWYPAEPSSVANFSAVAYFYGKVLQQVLEVPVGLIVSSWGGSTVEAWTDAEIYTRFKHLPSAQVPIGKENKTPSRLYNGMVHPFIPFKIKGAIWYQGESNCEYPKNYSLLFPAMIRSWREKWNQGNFPFYFVQLAPYAYEGNINSAFLREAQLYTMQTVTNTGMAVTLDIGNCNDIHPKNKKTVSNRLAYWALAKTYDIGGIACTAPVYKSMEKTGDGKITLFFEHFYASFTGFGKEITGFKIAGEDKIFYPAKSKINNKDHTITVWSESVEKPVAVRYAFENCVEGLLFNQEGLPVSSFRTDDWDE